METPNPLQRFTETWITQIANIAYIPLSKLQEEIKRINDLKQLENDDPNIVNIEVLEFSTHPNYGIIILTLNKKDTMPPEPFFKQIMHLIRKTTAAAANVVVDFDYRKGATFLKIKIQQHDNDDDNDDNDDNDILAIVDKTVLNWIQPEPKMKKYFGFAFYLAKFTHYADASMINDIIYRDGGLTKYITTTVNECWTILTDPQRETFIKQANAFKNNTMNHSLRKKIEDALGICGAITIKEMVGQTITDVKDCLETTQPAQSQHELAGKAMYTDRYFKFTVAFKKSDKVPVDEQILPFVTHAGLRPDLPLQECRIDMRDKKRLFNYKHAIERTQINGLVNKTTLMECHCMTEHIAELLINIGNQRRGVVQKLAIKIKEETPEGETRILKQIDGFEPIAFFTDIAVADLLTALNVSGVAWHTVEKAKQCNPFTITYYATGDKNHDATITATTSPDLCSTTVAHICKKYGPAGHIVINAIDTIMKNTQQTLTGKTLRNIITSGTLVKTVIDKCRDHTLHVQRQAGTAICDLIDAEGLFLPFINNITGILDPGPLIEWFNESFIDYVAGPANIITIVPNPKPPRSTNPEDIKIALYNVIPTPCHPCQRAIINHALNTAACTKDTKIYNDPV